MNQSSRMIKSVFEKAKSPSASGAMICFLSVLLLFGCKETHDVFIEPTFKHLTAQVAEVEHYPNFTIDYQAFHVDLLVDSTIDQFNNTFLESKDHSYIPTSTSKLQNTPRVVVFVHNGGFSKGDLKEVRSGMIEFFEFLESLSPAPYLSYFNWGGSSFYEVSRESMLSSLERKQNQENYGQVVDDLFYKVRKLESEYLEDVLVVVIGKVTVEVQLGSFREKVNSLDQNPHTWWALITEGTVYLPAEFQDSNCLLIQDINYESPFSQNLISKYEMLAGSYHRVAFSVTDPLEFDGIEDCVFSLPKLQVPEILLRIAFNPESVNEFRRGKHRERVLSLIKARDFDKALSAFSDYRNQSPEQNDLDSLARDLVSGWRTEVLLDSDVDSVEFFIDKICENLPRICADEIWWNDQVLYPLIENLAMGLSHRAGSPYDLLEYADRITTLMPEGAIWRQDLRLKMLLTLRDRFNTPETPWDFRLIIAEKILEIAPQDKEASFTHYRILAQNFEDKKQYLRALGSLKRAMAIKDSLRLSQEMRTLTSEGFAYYFSNSQYVSLIELHARYLAWDQDNFANRFYTFRAAEATKRSSIAVTELEWMARNWTDDQELIGWEELNESLHMHYLQAGELSKSLLLVKNLIQEDPDRIDKLGRYFMIGRMKPMKVFLELLVQIDSEMDSDRIFRSLFAKINLQKLPYHQELPYYLEYIALLESNGSEIKDCVYQASTQAKSYSKEISAGSLVSFAPSTSAGNETLSFLAPIGSKYCVVRVNSSLQGVDMSLASAIERVPDAESRWFMLQQQLRADNRDSFTYLISYALEASGDLDPNKLATWSKTIFNYSDLKYFVAQDENGAVVFSDNFNLASTQYPGDDWVRSSRSTALYRSYPESEGLKYEDMVQPIYDQPLWSGVVRFGFEAIQEKE